MKAEDILLALGQIDESLAENALQKRPAELSGKIITLKRIVPIAACLAIVLASVLLTNLFMVGSPIPVSENAADAAVTESITQPAEENETTETAFTEFTEAEYADLSVTEPVSAEVSAAQTTAVQEQISEPDSAAVPAGHTHMWSEATCEKPKTCRICGLTQGKALGHDYDEKKGYCKRCHRSRPGAAASGLVPLATTSSTVPSNAAASTTSGTTTTTQTYAVVTTTTTTTTSVIVSPSIAVIDPPTAGSSQTVTTTRPPAQGLGSQGQSFYTRFKSGSYTITVYGVAVRMSGSTYTYGNTSYNGSAYYVDGRPTAESDVDSTAKNAIRAAQQASAAIDSTFSALQSCVCIEYPEKEIYSNETTLYYNDGVLYRIDNQTFNIAFN